jgi:hypothetical protein
LKGMGEVAGPSELKFHLKDRAKGSTGEAQFPLSPTIKGPDESDGRSLQHFGEVPLPLHAERADHTSAPGRDEGKPSGPGHPSNPGNPPGVYEGFLEPSAVARGPTAPDQPGFFDGQGVLLGAGVGRRAKGRVGVVQLNQVGSRNPPESFPAGQEIEHQVSTVTGSLLHRPEAPDPQHLRLSGVPVRDPLIPDIDGVGVVEAEVGWDPRSELRLSLDHLTKGGMKRSILIGPKKPEVIAEFPRRHPGIGQKADAKPRPESYEAPDPLILHLGAGLGRDRDRAAARGDGHAHRKTGENNYLRDSGGFSSQLSLRTRIAARSSA